MSTVNPTHRAAGIALMITIVLLVIKFWAYFLTGSKAILSDALESIINLAAGLFLIFTVQISTTPADESHPYGHGKIDSFAAGLEGGFISLAGLMILIESLPHFFAPSLPKSLDTGIILICGASVVNLLLGRYLIRLGRIFKSDAIKANGRHLMTDFFTSFGVVIGLILVLITGWAWLDPLMACIVALNILIPGISLVRTAVKNLMNEADPHLLARIVKVLHSMRDYEQLCPHKLRAIRSGNSIHVDLHINLPHYWPLHRVHQVQEEMAKSLLAALGEEGDVMLHVDPCNPSCCPCCGMEPCPERTQPFSGTNHWKAGTITGLFRSCPVAKAKES